MAKKLKEYDYLYISARIHAMETKLLTRDRMERMLSARSAEEAAKVLAECGYGTSRPSPPPPSSRLWTRPGSRSSPSCAAPPPTRPSWTCSASNMTITTPRSW